jgi:hypothetical protein
LTTFFSKKSCKSLSGDVVFEKAKTALVAMHAFTAGQCRMSAATGHNRAQLMGPKIIPASLRTPRAFTVALPRRRLTLVRAEQKEEKEKKQADKLVKGAHQETVFLR